MHAVVVEVDVGGVERDVGLKNVREQIVPRVKQAPGFQSGWWLAPDQAGKGMSVVLFDSEEHARAAAEMVPVGSNPQPGVTVERAEVREVVASA
jgi:hypothetical protein